MEVFIRGVSDQGTEQALSQFLRPHFIHLAINPPSVSCDKKRGKPFAIVTFLRESDGAKFLARYGQTPVVQSNQYARPRRVPLAQNSLIFNGRQIHCSKSTKQANVFLLRSLAKEEKDREERSRQKISVQRRTAGVLPMVFSTHSLSCGYWNYKGSSLFFNSELNFPFTGLGGMIKFGDRNIMLTFPYDGKSYRIDFHHSGIYDIAYETNQSFIIKMYWAPSLYEVINPDAIIQLFATLSITPPPPGTPDGRRYGPTRHRISYINSEHKDIAGYCLAYRILVNESSSLDADTLSSNMQRLKQAAGMPPMKLFSGLTSNSVFKTSFTQQMKVFKSRILDGDRNHIIPYLVAFQVEKLVTNGYLPPSTVLALLPEVKRMAKRSSPAVCVSSLRLLFEQIDYAGPSADPEHFAVDGLIKLLRSNEEHTQQYARERYELVSDSENVAIIHRVKVTPCGITLYGPEPETNNRVLRKYPKHHEYFLRVEFCDEDSQPIKYSGGISNERIFNGRFQEVMSNGIEIAGRRFSFLGFSHSSLRAQTCWFIAPFIHRSSLEFGSQIIRDLGDFSDIRCPAKCAARIGQAFSDTAVAVTINQDIVRIIPDVERNGRVFSDGVGTISSSIVRKLRAKLAPTHRRATCFQIRYGGAKGMLVLDTRLQGDVVNLRPSMIKFKGSNSTDIEICDAASKPLPMYLNRQLIKILEDLGVSDDWFLDLQAKQIKILQSVTESATNASSFLQKGAIGEIVNLPWFIKAITMIGLDFRSDDFFRRLLEMAVLMELRILKHKTRIPVDQGHHLHGVMDETGFLKEGQIYCTFDRDGKSMVLVRKDLLISRAPALHPGDVQWVEAVPAPPNSPLIRLKNCICFSSQGERDLPSKLSGGDLDGDRYFIIWDQKARAKCTYTPADYTRQDPVDIQREVEPKDMTEFFIQFMETDQLPRIAVNHRVLADQRISGTADVDCLTLAEMHSTAVDFSKTGIPVDMSKMPRFNTRTRPDFEAPGPHVKVFNKTELELEFPPAMDSDPNNDDDEISRFRYYESDKILGKLYRAIDEGEVFAQLKAHSKKVDQVDVILKVWEYIQQACQAFMWKHHIPAAREVQEDYEDNLLVLMSEFADSPRRPLLELEAFIGNILGRTSVQSQRQRDQSVHIKDVFNSNVAYTLELMTKDADGDENESLEFSMACLHVALEKRDERSGQKKGEKEDLVSFTYVAAAVCLKKVETSFGGFLSPLSLLTRDSVPKVQSTKARAR